MLLLRIVSPVFSANAYILATGPGQEAVVVDPGARTADAIAEALTAHNLTVGAVLLTHGHPDHVWDTAAVAGRAPVYIPGPDRYRLEDPLAHVRGLGQTEMFVAAAGAWVPPENVHEFPAAWFAGGGEVTGIPVVAVPAPGHTEGSTITLTTGRWEATGLRQTHGHELSGDASIALGGDVIFAGSVGRTDLSGGDERTMLSTLRTLQQVIDPETWILPGHGPVTTMGFENDSNPHFAYARRVG